MLGSRSNNFLRNLFTLLSIYSGIFLVLFMMEAASSNTKIFSVNNFLNWDAAHYFAVMQNGYHDENVAFFPLFPVFWRIIHASIAGISIINGLLYIVALAWLAAEFNIQRKNLLLVASVSSLIFMFLPFSEAVFFFTTAMILVGLNKESMLLVCTGLFLAGCARPVATIFIPAILVAEYLCNREGKVRLERIFLQLFFCLLGIFIVFVLQYKETGKWFTFFEYQKNWDNYLRLPKFPLASWAGGYIVRLDALAFFCGVAAFVWLTSITMKAKAQKKDVINKPLVFSLAYLTVLTLTVLFTKGGTFNSFNRYLFASSFFLFAFHSFLERNLFRWKNVLVLFVGSSLSWLLFASYVHIQYLLKFEVLTIYLCVIYLATYNVNKKISRMSFAVIAGVNIFFFLAFMHRFLSGEWVG